MVQSLLQTAPNLCRGMRRVLLLQEAEATFIKEYILRHNWNPVDLRRWQEDVARLAILRLEMAALAVGAPASAVRQERSRVSAVTEESCSPDTAQQGAVMCKSAEAENLPRPEAEVAAETIRSDSDRRAISRNSHSVQPSDDMHGVDMESDNSPIKRPQGSAEGMQHGGSEDVKEVNSRALFRAVRLDNCRDVEALLEAGCDADAQDADGHTPLYIAAEREFLACTPMAASTLAAGHFCCGGAAHPPLTCVPVAVKE